MARVLITGSAGGLGRAAAAALLDDGHEVVVHARSRDRLAGAQELLERGAQAVTGDLADAGQTRALADQVNGLGHMDAVIHNAAMYRGPEIPAVNVVAPFLLTALIERPSRLVYLSSGMHRGGRASLRALHAGGRGAMSYSDSKLFLTTLAFAVARRWPDVRSNAVDPGWVPTRMGGAGAPDDLELGHVTQVWLAVSDDPGAQVTGRYWYHQEQYAAHPSAEDPEFQDRLVDTLGEMTGTVLP